MSFLLLAASLAVAAPAVDRALYDRLCERTAAAYDSARGGFVQDDVPSEAAVELGLKRGRETDAPVWTAWSLATIAWTRGLRDTVGGGLLHQASHDPRGSILLKRTDSNARRLENFLLAWRLTDDSSFRADAARVADYMDRVLLDGRGGFLADQAQADLVPDANGYAIHAWLTWAAATRDAPRREFALRSLDRIWDVCWMPEMGLTRRGVFGEVTVPPQLSDQVEMGRALVLAARLAGRDRDAERARTLGDLVLERFTDREKGGFLTQWAVGKSGKTKRAPRQSLGNARAALFLGELAALSGDARYSNAAREAWSSFAGSFEKSGLVAADWALAVRATLEPDLPAVPKWREPQAPPVARRSVSFGPTRR